MVNNENCEKCRWMDVQKIDSLTCDHNTELIRPALLTFPLKPEYKLSNLLLL